MYKPKLPANIDLLKWVGPDDPNYAESGLIHCARIPATATPARPVPVVVMLHGWGGNESVMWIFKQTLPAGVAAFTLRAPLELAGGGFVWFEETNLHPKPDTLASALNTLALFLTALPRLYPIDPTHMILMGFSQGAFVGNAFVLTHPYDTSGVVSLAGAMPRLPGVEYHANLLAGMPVFIAHGLRDEAIPVSAARQTRDAYRELGADVTYGEYPVAHKMNPQAMKDLKVWLARLFTG